MGLNNLFSIRTKFFWVEKRSHALSKSVLRLFMGLPLRRFVYYRAFSAASENFRAKIWKWSQKIQRIHTSSLKNVIKILSTFKKLPSEKIKKISKQNLFYKKVKALQKMIKGWIQRKLSNSRWHQKCNIHLLPIRCKK